MLIQRMSAVFGRLRNETLQLQDGLNIIEAPNETGKSTWCAFLTAMLYGINSRERDKAGFIADKNRYAPWDGGSMSGRLECHADGADLTITRTTRRQTAPMTDFQAVYTGTASPVEGLTGANCGETLLGVSREVFERSAFIRQSGLAITQDAGLERRVASLISTAAVSIRAASSRPWKRSLRRSSSSWTPPFSFSSSSQTLWNVLRRWSPMYRPSPMNWPSMTGGNRLKSAVN